MVFITACAGKTSVKNTVVEVETYEGISQGFRGQIRVLVYMGADGIRGIETDHEEDEFVGGAAIDTLTEAVLNAGSTEVDAISGATESSIGFLEAVNDALKE
jgi:fumarate reductase flavoprotein subunit